MEGIDEIQEMLTENGNEPIVDQVDEVAAEVAAEDISKDDVGAGDSNTENPLLENDSEDKPEDDGAKSSDFNVAEHFEGFETIDDVKAAVDRSKLYTNEVEEELETLRQSKTAIETLQSEIKELKSRQPFKNEKFYQLDKLSEEDPEKAAVYQKFLFGDNSDEAVIKLRMQIEHPSRYKENPGFLQRQMERKYANYFGDEFTADDVEYQDAKTQMGIDADDARHLFNSEIDKVEVPKAKTEEDLKAESEAFFKGWQEPFAKVKTELTKLQIPVLNEKDQTKTERFMDYPIPEADLKEVYNTAGQYIANQRLEPTKESMAEAVKVALGVYLSKNFAKINTTFANELAKETGAKWRKRVNNSQKPGADNKVKDGGANKPAEGSGDSIYGEIMGS